MRTAFGIITEDMTKRHPICSYMLKSPHVLIAGTTGSGKSVMMNSMIYTALREPVEDFYFIDLKRVELKAYKNLERCRWFCTEPEEVIPMLNMVVNEMERRYKKMKGKLYEGGPVYVFIDELADLVSHKDAKDILERLVKIGRLGRAAKVHLVCATQDPSRKTLCSALMQNFTCCLALRCRSAIESRQIIGTSGAEFLPEYGCGLLWDAKGTRQIDVPMTPEEDIEKMVFALSSRTFPLTMLLGLFSKNVRTVEKNYQNRITQGLAEW